MMAAVLCWRVRAHPRRVSFPWICPDQWTTVPHATAMVFENNRRAGGGPCTGAAFSPFPALKTAPQWELPYLAARHYDGRGIVRTPTGRIGFWSAGGFAHATLARPRYLPKGRVITYRLDSGRYQTAWGRIFVDACIPRGTRVSILCRTMDDPPDPEDVEPLTRTVPANNLAVTIHRPDLSPLPPKDLMRQPATQRLYRRSSGNEPAWPCASGDDGVETFEAPVIAPRGRYLWMALDLHGTTGRTPRIKRVRVEYPGHTLLRRLPQVYSRDPAAADFLRRYLAILDGSLREMDLRAMLRHVLLNPNAAPDPVLPWLAQFIGLALDERWPESARRELIAEGIWLFRYPRNGYGPQTLHRDLSGAGPEDRDHRAFQGSGAGGRHRR